MTTTGLAKRVDELAAAVKARAAAQTEAQGRQLFDVLRSALTDLGLDVEDPAVRCVVAAAVRRHTGDETGEDRAGGQAARERWAQRRREQGDLNVAARSWELHEQAVRDGAACEVDRASRERAAQRLAADAAGRRGAQHGSDEPGLSRPTPEGRSVAHGSHGDGQQALPPGTVDEPGVSRPLPVTPPRRRRRG